MDLVPILVQQPNQQMNQIQQQLLAEAAPAKVRFALDFLCHLTLKTAPYVMRVNGAIDAIDGQQLSKAELNAQASAANLLNDYFVGKWKAPMERRRKMIKSKLPPMTCNCLGKCPTCEFCNGSGKVIITPA